MKTKTIPYYTDPGHGWIKVSLKELEKYDLMDKISTYSYIRKDYAYLEEDGDANIYVRKLARKLTSMGIEAKLKILNSNKSSKIRSNERFSH